MNKLPPCLSFLGLLNRGGMTLIGPAITGKKKPYLIILATDASPRSKKEIISYCKKEGIPLDNSFNKSLLGLSLGFEEISAVGISDKKAAESYLHKASRKERI